MDRIRPGYFGGGDDAGDLQVAFPAGGRPDADRLVREPDMERIPVRLGIDRHGLDPELLADPYDAEGDLPPVRDEDLLEHPWSPEYQIMSL